jgi:hypothetical protein
MTMDRKNSIVPAPTDARHWDGKAGAGTLPPPKGHDGRTET